MQILGWSLESGLTKLYHLTMYFQLLFENNLNLIEKIFTKLGNIIMVHIMVL